MPLTYRFNTVQTILGSYLAPHASLSVTALKPGGVASASSTGATLTLHAGHGFAAGDKIIVGGDASTFSGSQVVSSTTATSITMDGGTYNVASGDTILNLGADTGTSAPNWDAGRTIYSDPTGNTVISNSTATTNSEGEYQYYHANNVEVWEVIRSGSTILDVIQSASRSTVLTPTSSTDNAIVRFDGTDGRALQGYTSGAPTIGDTGKATFNAGFLLDNVRLDGLGRSRHIWNALRSPYSAVGIYHRDDHDKEHYVLLQQIDDYRWWGHELFNWSGATGSTACNCLSLNHIYKAFLSVAHDDVSVTESGDWATSAGSNASAYNNTYRASNTTNDYVEWTAPANTVDLGIRTPCATNAGLAKVTIGGDATAANMLYTAQELVDLGEYPNTILVANGGTLNPTDRVLDFDARAGRLGAYADTLEYDVFIPIATNLAADAHVVRLTVTGYKHASATDDRVFSSGYMYRLATTAMADANVVPMRVENVMSVPRFKDSIEYALVFNPSGGNYNSFIGNRAHGYDNQTSIALRLDGATLSSTQDTLYLGNVVEVTRVSELRHPDYGGGTSAIADVTVLYRMTQDGLMVAVEMDWNADVTASTNYTAMCSVSRDKLDKGSTSGMTSDSTFIGDDSNPGNTSDAGDMIWAWDSDGNLAVACYVPDTTMTCNDFPMTSHKTFWVDYSSSTYAKAYFSRSRSGQINESISSGTKTRALSYRRLGYFADADLVMAR